MMTVMVPDLVPPTDEIRGLCTHIAADLHDVRRLVVGSTSFQAGSLRRQL
jgi:hypothetical protein